ncbi:MAG: ABC transporter ATP-binding protein [Kofleriaceae bacterium]|jgi:hypothetical protein|nr:ABC transporter ATP-binding protein [Kofleriaceae bacterium]MBP6837752.1 ABC transporter ATP-binding protein [Kofleriaceae bacterium]MBP9205800.1 ABC transporter ATP-binding protein [Kofleriaceae bacterium]
MERPRARPKFTLHDPRSPDEIAACLRVHLERGPGKVTGDVMRRTVMLTIAEEHRHFWTPHLDLQLGEAKGGGTHLDGTLGPHPKLWYTFLMVQAMFAMASIAAAVYLFSQWSVGGALLWPAVVLGAMLFGGGFSYGAAYVGQGLGSDQMYELRSFVDHALEG